jgi:NAD-dependent deacetylase sirtuin 1
METGESPSSESLEELSEGTEASSPSGSTIYSSALALLRGERHVRVGASETELRKLLADEIGPERLKELVEETKLDEETILATVLASILERGYVRPKLPEINTLSDVVSLLRNSENILVLCGAGISTSLGIPDFRSEGGIYERVQARYPFLDDPQMLFDLDQFLVDPRPFYEFAAEIFPPEEALRKPSFCHRFIAQLERSGKLLRCYTQNIDGLERAAGISRTIFCHGSFDTLRCVKCNRSRAICEQDRHQIRRGNVIYCERCTGEEALHANDKRSSLDDGLASDSEDSCGSDGFDPEPVMKPGIVFFGEPLPQEFFDSIEDDLRRADMLLVIGTSLQVAPVADMPRSLDASVPQILVNREVVARARIQFDVELLGDCDFIVRLIAELLGWSDKIGDTERCSLAGDPEQYFQLPSRYVFPGARLDPDGAGHRLKADDMSQNPESGATWNGFQ